MNLLEANQKATVFLREAAALREAISVAGELPPERYYFAEELARALGHQFQDARLIAKNAIISAFSSAAVGAENAAYAVLREALASRIEDPDEQ